MRQRITCLVLLIALTIPAAGWTKAAEHDPWGQDVRATSPIAPGTDRDSTRQSAEAALSQPPADLSGVSLFHGFLDWIRTQLLGF